MKAVLIIATLATTAGAEPMHANTVSVELAGLSERGVIVAASSGTRIDLTGVVLESGDSVPARFAGIGIASKDVDNVSILGGTIRGVKSASARQIVSPRRLKISARANGRRRTFGPSC